MELSLTIDRGNSAVKAAVWRGDELVEVLARRHAAVGELVSELALKFGATGRTKPFGNAVYCSVVRDCDEDAVRDVWSVARRVVVLRHDTPMPVRLAYATPATLGHDRIAAALGARALAGEGMALLVADIGTAVTYDFLSADDVFEGGNIAPGIFMRLEALHAFTSALPAVETDGAAPVWGTDTASAMRGGAVRGVLAELEYYRSQLPGDAVTVVTGGSAELILGHIPFPHIYNPHLVHYGLKRIEN